MSQLFNLTFESGVLTGTDDSFDSAVSDGGDLSVDAAAALGGSSNGLQLVIDDTTAIYGQKNQSAPASDQIRFRYHIHPHSLTMSSGDLFNNLHLDASGSPREIHRIRLRWTGSSYRLVAVPYGDGGKLSADIQDIANVEHYVETHIERATGPSAADGRIRWWIDGSLMHTWSGVDNYDLFSNINRFRLGAVYSIDSGTSGTFFIDEFAANDDGSEIGPAYYIARARSYFMLA